MLFEILWHLDAAEQIHSDSICVLLWPRARPARQRDVLREHIRRCRLLLRGDAWSIVSDGPLYRLEWIGCADPVDPGDPGYTREISGESARPGARSRELARW